MHMKAVSSVREFSQLHVAQPELADTFYCNGECN